MARLRDDSIDGVCRVGSTCLEGGRHLVTGIQEQGRSRLFLCSMLPVGWSKDGEGRSSREPTVTE